MYKRPAAGIDLGAAYDCMGVSQQRKVQRIAKQDNWTSPGYVAFTDSEQLIGDAVNEAAM